MNQYIELSGVTVCRVCFWQREDGPAQGSCVRPQDHLLLPGGCRCVSHEDRLAGENVPPIYHFTVLWAISDVTVVIFLSLKMTILLNVF